jgi:hypothetical protein
MKGAKVMRASILTNSEDQKLLTLANASLQRNKVKQSAALRDGTGRTHVGNAIGLTTLSLDALQVALAMALSSGAEVIEAAVVVGEPPSEISLENIREISKNSLIWHEAGDGSIHAL